MALKTFDRSKLSMGWAPLEAYGLADKHTPVVTSHQESPNLAYYTPMDTGIADSQRALMGLRPGETAIAITVPGQVEHLRNIGLLRGASVLEITATKNDVRMHGDVLAHLIGNRVQFDKGSMLVPVYPSDEMAHQADLLGMSYIPLPSINITNSKATLSRDSIEFGFNTIPRAVIRTDSDIQNAVEKFAGAKTGAWLKYPLAAGGLGIIRIESVTTAALTESLKKLRSNLEKFYNSKGASSQFKTFWPDSSAGPSIGIALELDWNNIGIARGDFCTHLFVDGLGGMEIVEQIMNITSSSGKYLGGVRAEVDAEIWSAAEPHIVRFAQSQWSKGYKGLLVIDWTAIDVKEARYLPHGAEGLYIGITDPNARSAGGSTYSMIPAHILGAGSFKGIKVRGPAPIFTISDFIETIGPLAFGDPGKSGLVLPFSVEPGSTTFRIAVLGKDKGHVDHILRQGLIGARRVELLTG